MPNRFQCLMNNSCECCPWDRPVTVLTVLEPTSFSGRSKRRRQQAGNCFRLYYHSWNFMKFVREMMFVGVDCVGFSSLHKLHKNAICSWLGSQCPQLVCSWQRTLCGIHLNTASFKFSFHFYTAGKINVFCKWQFRVGDSILFPNQSHLASSHCINLWCI